MTTHHRFALLAAMARGPASAADLAQALGIHQTSVSRALQPLQQSGQVVRLGGQTRGARYGSARAVRAIGTSWPLYEVDTNGLASELGTLHAIAPEHFAVRGGPPRIAGLTQGIPYFLQDARPAGFLGRAVPAAYPELDLPARVQDWGDDHALIFLTQRGSDVPGNLIVGAESLDRYLSCACASPLVPAENRGMHYPALAHAAMLGPQPGSSAHGEHPKFSVKIVRDSVSVDCLVKFSPPRGTALGTRWADLLVAEFVSSQVLSGHGIAAANNRLLEFDGQVFLESERFDRLPAAGRRGAVSLFSVDAARYGRLDRWSSSAQRLHAEHLLSAQDLERVRLMDAFGSLIANTDRHFGNITLFDDYEGPYALAPIYDMLPMLFAPEAGQLIERPFEPAGATAATLSVWPRARELAEVFWLRLCEESRLSDDFRRQSEKCLATVRRLSRQGTAAAR